MGILLFSNISCNVKSAAKLESPIQFFKKLNCSGWGVLWCFVLGFFLPFTINSISSMNGLDFKNFWSGICGSLYSWGSRRTFEKGRCMMPYSNPTPVPFLRDLVPCYKMFLGPTVRNSCEPRVKDSKGLHTKPKANVYPHSIVQMV